MLPVRQTATPVGNPRIEKAESGRRRSNARRTASDTKKFYNLNRLRFAASGANVLTQTKKKHVEEVYQTQVENRRQVIENKGEIHPGMEQGL